MRLKEERASRGEHRAILHKGCHCACISVLIGNDVMIDGYIRGIICVWAHTVLFAGWCIWISDW